MSKWWTRTYPSSPPVTKLRPSGANATELMGPKWPRTLPNSSVKMRWKKRASKPPALAEVVVTWGLGRGAGRLGQRF
jgi:hypothetical protein